MGASQFPVRASTLSWPAFLLVSGSGLVTLFVLLSPESSRSLKLVDRMLFWLLHVGGLLCLMQSAQSLLSRFLAPPALGSWGAIVSAGLIGALLFAPLGAGLDSLFGLAEATDDTDPSWAFLILEDFAAIAPPSVLTWVGLNAVRNLRLPTLVEVSQRSSPAAQAQTEGDDAAPTQSALPEPAVIPVRQDRDPPFWHRVPASLGRDLVCLSAELHYLRVETTKGNTLILYPFGQAVQELAAINREGLRIHRSHWVAPSHVVAIRREGARLFCVMAAGTTLPVGRRRQAEVCARLSDVLKVTGSGDT